eukprot:scaffold215920_cov41-Tisochrysis_lutea.AAC.1
MSPIAPAPKSLCRLNLTELLPGRCSMVWAIPSPIPPSSAPCPLLMSLGRWRSASSHAVTRREGRIMRL